MIIIEAEGHRFSGRLRTTPSRLETEHPLLIAIHGGTYTSAYFDVPGYSLLDRAAANGIPSVAIDRPGYGESTPLEPAEATHSNNVTLLNAAIGEIWKRHGGSAKGVVLIGHSIGAAIAARIAASRPPWPLLGLAVSGIGLATAPGDAEAWHALPPIPLIELPADLKDAKMFGSPETYAPSAPAISSCANAPAPRQDLIDIVSDWPANVREHLRAICVPVHYRQAAEDHLWVVDDGQVQDFAGALVNAPEVDHAMVPHTGHCIDFHRLGAAFQLEQLAFALRCAITRRNS